MNLAGKLCALAALSILVFAGCDFGADEETITLQDDVIFRFEFDADDHVVGEPFSVVSSRSQSIRSALSDQGYTLEQLVNARVTSGVAEVLFPLDASVSFLDQLSVRLKSDTEQTDVVASRLDISPADTGDTLDLDAFSSVEIGPPLRAGNFSASLDLVANDGIQPGESYEFAVQLQVSMDVLFQ